MNRFWRWTWRWKRCCSGSAFRRYFASSPSWHGSTLKGSQKLSRIYSCGKHNFGFEKFVIQWLILFFGFQYVEMSRCNLGQSLYEEASRVLQHCLTLQPHCSPVLLAMAKVEVTRGRTPAADRLVSPNNRYLDQPRHYRFLIFQTSR